MTLTYQRRGEVVRTVEPLGLVLKTGSWYLVGRVGADLRTYRVDRATAVEVTDTVFRRDDTFDLASFWAERAVEFERSVLTDRVTIRLSPTGRRMLRYAVEAVAARAVEAQAGPPDEHDWVVAELPVESVGVAYTQLLRLGPEVEVLEPEPLRDLLRAAAERMAALYQV